MTAPVDALAQLAGAWDAWDTACMLRTRKRTKDSGPSPHAPAMLGEERPQIGVGRDEEVHRPPDAQAAVDLIGALRVDLRFGEEDVLTPLLVVVRGLKQ